MYQCILNTVALWDEWTGVTYLQVHGSPLNSGENPPL